MAAIVISSLFFVLFLVLACDFVFGENYEQDTKTSSAKTIPTTRTDRQPV
jgi:hypothetical protein